MSETTAVEAETVEETEVPETDATSVEEQVETVDWEDKFKGQQKVNRDLEKKLKTLSDAQKATQEEAELKNKSAEEQAVELARREAREEATKAANGRLVRAELKAAAKGRLADVSDALLNISIDDFEVSDDGEVDAAALDAAIDDLLTRKPHLAPAKQARFDGSADQGAKAGTTPSQLTEADLARMSAAGDDEGIVKAKAEGRLNNILGIK